MLNLLSELQGWLAEDRNFVVATRVSVGGSALLGAAALAVDEAGTVIGSVSGECAQRAVYDVCVQVLETGESVRNRFSCSDEDALAMGLTFGSVLDIVVMPVFAGTNIAALLKSALDSVTSGQMVAMAR